MTPEQLDEIEAQINEFGEESGFILPLVKALREAWADKEEALGDARLAECQLDEIVELVGSGGDGSAFGSVESLLCDLKERTEERDNARAEVERLKAGRDYDAKVIPDLMRELEDAKLLLSVKIGTVEAQRQLLADNGVLLLEAKAEVERVKAEREEALERVEYLEETIRDNIPYAYDQGEPDEDAATPEECVEYAAGEIAQLKKDTARLRSALRLLWEEAQDKCAIRDATTDAVEAALKEGE